MVPWIISGFTVLAVLGLDKVNNKAVKAILNWFPAILFAYVIPAITSELANVDFSNHEIHSFSKNFVIPMAIVTVMSTLSIRQLRAMGWKPILVFVSGSFWIALFPILFALLFLGADWIQAVWSDQVYWKGIPPIVGSWIGGSTSMLVLKELVECPENIFLNILILDNILVNIWTIIMFQVIKKTDFLNQKLKIQAQASPDLEEQKDDHLLSPILVFSLLLASVFLVNFITSSLIIKILILSGVGLMLSNFLKTWPFKFVLQLGGILIIMVMAILGLKLKFNLIQVEPSFLIFLLIWLIGHFLFMLLMAKVLNISTVWVPIASMANVGGIATAPAVTAAYDKRWMPHAIILAVLSMTTGTFWGMITIALLRMLF